MNSLTQFLSLHPFALPAAMFVVSAAVSNMPEPDQASGKGYRWFYGTVHMVVGNIGNVITAAKGGKVPQAPQQTGGKYKV